MTNKIDSNEFAAMAVVTAIVAIGFLAYGGATHSVMFLGGGIAFGATALLMGAAKAHDVWAKNRNNTQSY